MSNDNKPGEQVITNTTTGNNNNTGGSCSSLLYTDALRRMEETAISSLSPDDNIAYMTACQKCPDLIEKESNRTRFLRFCKYDPIAAAKRLVGYWKLRLDIFGDDRCYKPIIDFSGNGAFCQDMLKLLDTGLGYLIPPNKDGSVVICFDYSNTAKNNKRLGIVTKTAEWKVKIVFFFSQLAAIAPDDASLRTNGVIYIQFIREQRHTPSPHVFQTIQRIGQDGFPFTVKAIHQILAPRDLPDKKLDTFRQKTIPYISQMLKNVVSYTHREIDYIVPAERCADNNNNNSAAHTIRIQRAKITNALMDRVGILDRSLPKAAGGPWTYSKMKRLLKTKKGLQVYWEVQQPSSNNDNNNGTTNNTRNNKKTTTTTTWGSNNNTSLVWSQRYSMKEILNSPQGVSIYSDIEFPPSWTTTTATTNDARRSASSSQEKDEGHHQDSSSATGQQGTTTTTTTTTPLALLADAAASLLASDDSKKSQCSLFTIVGDQQQNKDHHGV